MLDNNTALTFVEGIVATSGSIGTDYNTALTFVENNYETITIGMVYLKGSRILAIQLSGSQELNVNLTGNQVLDINLKGVV